MVLYDSAAVDPQLYDHQSFWARTRKRWCMDGDKSSDTKWIIASGVEICVPKLGAVEEETLCSPLLTVFPFKLSAVTEQRSK